MSESPRLLVADGDAAARASIAQILRGAGYEVIESTTAAAALDAALTADLLVLGEGMSDMDGTDFKRRLRTRTATARLPVVHLSRSFADGESAVDFDAGCDACLVPPAAPPVLLSMVKNLLFAQQGAAAERRNLAEFIATVSHELRNPLNAILGWATVLNRKPGLPDTVTKALQAIERNSRIQAQMISDLLDYASISVGKLSLVAETVDPYPVVKGALDAMNAAAQTQGVVIQATFGRGPVLIQADTSRLQQIVCNLLSNAVRFSPSGGRIELDVAPGAGNSLSVVVTDHGAGIEPVLLPGIFEPFSRQDASQREGGHGGRSHAGLGLGLAIVKRLTELHGGSIHAHSAGQGTGATFTITLPLTHFASQ